MRLVGEPGDLSDLKEPIFEAHQSSEIGEVMTNKKETSDILNFAPLENSGVHTHDLTKATNDRLERTVRALVLVSQTYSAESRAVRKTIQQMEATIKELDRKNGKLQLAIFALTIVTLVAAFIQIWTALQGN